MTRTEAIECLKEGYRITHELFTSDEWVGLDLNGYMVCESGYIDEKEFWEIRKDGVWETGWRIFENE